MSKQPSRGYFVVGSESFHHACGLGLNPACVFLVLARGSGPDDVATAWSAEAAQRRLGIRWTTAKHAITELAGAGLLQVVRGGTRPQYQLAKAGEAIILPNTLVEGAGNEAPPLRRARETQDVLVLRLLVDLYRASNLPEFGGVDPGVLWHQFETKRIGERGSFTAWRFTSKYDSVTWNAITSPHRLAESEIPPDGNAGSAFFPRLELLKRDGLLDLIPTVYEGPTGEPLFPLCGMSEIEIEGDLAHSAACAGHVVAPEWEQDEEDDVIVPLPSRFMQPIMRGHYRLRYRPQTAGTTRWFREHMQTCRIYKRDFDRIMRGDTAHSFWFGLPTPVSEPAA